MSTESAVHWACRRGMKELDLLLMPFFNQCYSALSSNEKQRFQALLNVDDPTLYRWMMRQHPPEPEFSALIDQIRCFRSNNDSP